jgi:SMODS-associating 2TM, beta-strand rich effector domain
MANVSLSTGELKKALLFVSLMTVGVGAAVGLVRHYAFGADPTAALVVGLVSGASWSVLFSSWALRRTWTWNWLAWATGRPIIHGVWFGHLCTNYESHDGSVGKRIPIAFVIRQTFLGYSLLSYTERQDSVTLAETLDVDDKHDTVHLRYMYRFQIMRENERKQTTGAGELKLIENGTKLKGHYLTDSPTQGSAELALVQREVDGIDTFRAVHALHQTRLSTPVLSGPLGPATLVNLSNVITKPSDKAD